MLGERQKINKNKSHFKNLHKKIIIQIKRLSHHQFIFKHTKETLPVYAKKNELHPKLFRDFPALTWWHNMAKKASDKKKQVFEARPPVSLSLFGPFLSVKMSTKPRLHYNNSPSCQPTAPKVYVLLRRLRVCGTRCFRTPVWIISIREQIGMDG